MISLKQMDADAALSQLNQSADDRLEFRINAVGTAKPKIKKIAKNIQIIDGRVYTNRFFVAGQ